MTDRIDLDELDAGEEGEETPDANPGDWFWRGEGDPVDEPEPKRVTGPAADVEDVEGAGEEDARVKDDGGERDADESDPTPQAAPHVPRTDAGKPAGIPTEYGGPGAGGHTGGDVGTGASEEPPAEPRPAGSAADGPHGGGVDDMTIAFTYDALRRIANPAAVFADASAWADWIGIVGDVDTHHITSFQRTHALDADFFTGSGTSSSERLRDIDRTSMFYAERMVVVGIAESDEAIAEAADWEYVPLESAAEKADWDLQG